MLFSEHFKISKNKEDDWFDTYLRKDTQLFIDPILLLKDQTPLFQGSYDHIMHFFNQAFKLIADAGSMKDAPSYKKAVKMLELPEVKSIQLGYSQSFDTGAGVGKDFAEEIASAINESIIQSIKSIKYIEEISLFKSVIGLIY